MSCILFKYLVALGLAIGLLSNTSVATECEGADCVCASVDYRCNQIKKRYQLRQIFNLDNYRPFYDEKEFKAFFEEPPFTITVLYVDLHETPVYDEDLFVDMFISEATPEGVVTDDGFITYRTLLENFILVQYDNPIKPMEPTFYRIGIYDNY